MWGKYYPPEKLYAMLMRPWFSRYNYRKVDLGEGMTAIEYLNEPEDEEVPKEWYQTYLLNHDSKHAWIIRSQGHVFIGGRSDIDWDVMEFAKLDYGPFWRMAEHRCSILPVNVRPYRNGVAEMVWQINPNYKLLSDSQGYPASDIEVNLHAFIDREANVLVKFRTIDSKDELKVMEDKALALLRDK